MINFRRLLSVIMLFGVVGAFSAAPAPTAPEPAAASHDIVRENQMAGTTDWQIEGVSDPDTLAREAANPDGFGGPNRPAAAWTDDRDIKGYANHTSINQGDSINFHISTTQSGYDIEVYRLGWYGGSGGRLITAVTGLTGSNEPIPSPDPTTGMIEANWPVSYTLQTDTGWVSGLYLAKLIASNGADNYIFFVVRNDSSNADILFQVVTSTYQAYNNWGGKSLYDSNSDSGRSYKVSYNRPYEQRSGAGYVFDGDYQLARWLEREGYSVTYATNEDLHSNPNLLDNHKVFLSNYHDEYWSWEMRENITASRDAGVDLAFLTSNNIYWQIRYENVVDGRPRTIVCYKDAALDPFNGTVDEHLTTVLWRDPPVNKPENELLGVMYHGDFGDTIHYDYIVQNADHWIYDGTNLQNGDAIPEVIGDEYDMIFDNGLTPANLVVLSSSPIAATGGTSNATIYQAGSGAYVFDASTNRWALKLDDTKYDTGSVSADSNIEIMTRNLLDEMIGSSPTPPATMDAYIYDDALTWEWDNNNSPAATVDFGNTLPVYMGTRSIAYTADSGQSLNRISLQNFTLFSTSPYDTFEITMRATQAGQRYYIYFWDENNNGLGNVYLHNYGGEPAVDSWTTYQIPLVDLGAVDKQIKYFWLRPVASNQPPVYIDEIKFTTTVIPVSAPTDLSADVVSTSQIDLTWTDNANDETGYEVERSIDGGAWTTLAVLAANSEAYSDTTVSYGNEYRYRVRAERSGVYSDYSNIVTPDFLEIIEAEAPQVIADGNWTNNNDASASGGVFLTAGTQDDSLTLIFAGPRLDVVYVAGPAYGAFNIEIDGTIVRTVDSNYPTLSYGLEATIDYLADETHIVRIIPVGGTVALDAFEAVISGSETAPAVPSLTTPANNATIETTTPTFSWSEVSDATHYELWVTSGSGTASREWYTSAVLSCDGGVCSTALDNELTNLESYDWQVRAANRGGSSAWSASRDFTIDLPVPDVIILTAPSGEVSDTFTPTYQWESDDIADSYELVVNDSQDAVVLQETYPASVCGGAACGVTPSTQLGHGNFTWKVRGINAIGEGPWGTPEAFEIVTGIVEYNAPTDEVIVTNPVFEWTKAVYTEWYRLQVLDDAQAVVHDQWYQDGAAVDCSSGTCAVNAGLNLATGAYTWRIQAWATLFGAAPWNPDQAFTVVTTEPLAPIGGTTLQPAGGQVTFEFRELSGITEYEIWVNDSAGKFYNQLITPDSCATQRCEFTPATPFPSADYTWWVRGKSGNQVSNWSASATFKTSIPAPDIPTGLSDSLHDGDSRAELRWGEAARATWYLIEIRLGSQTGTIVHSEWYALTELHKSGSDYIRSIDLSQPGSYHWHVKSWSPDGQSGWSAWDSFTVDPISLVTVIDTTQDEATGRGDFVYTWNRPDNRVEWYRLRIGQYDEVTERRLSVVHDEWYPVGGTSALSCNASQCDLDPGLFLKNGFYRVWVGSWAPVDPEDNWNDMPDRLELNLNLPVPGKVTTGFNVDLTAPDQPEFQWDDVSDAAWYQLWIKSPSGNKLFAQWYLRQDICSGGDCAVTPDIYFGSGVHTWWVQTYGPAGAGPWSDEQEVDIPGATVPGTPSLQQPSGQVTNTLTPDFVWDRMPNATRYELWVNRSGSKYYSVWVPASACPSDPCSYTPSFELDKNGTYDAWVRAANTSGSSDWSSSAQQFSVQMNLAPAPTLSAPADNAVLWGPATFTWSDVDTATWFYLMIDQDSAQYQYTWYNDEAAQCGAGSCSVEVNLPPGTYTWSVRSWNASGDGGTSSSRSVTIY
ncbi:MAG: fibronectin type III domain-containing protein [Chloroflexi bacterium]|nr:fibronectin type III domain-containing protein [Chloroflexota bacterium]